MKDKLIYIVSFLFAFVLVSGALIYFNSIYNNIFKFDFSPVKAPLLTQVKNNDPAQNQNPGADSLKKDSTKVKIDSLAVKPDSSKLGTIAKQDSIKNDSKKENLAKGKKEEPKNTLAQNKNDKISQQPAANLVQSVQSAIPPSINDKLSKAKKDSIYSSWVKENVKLYESMDSKKAAKVIKGYSDNIARDILLKMKKKKAAEILAELKPEDVTRIISVN